MNGEILFQAGVSTTAGSLVAQSGLAAAGVPSRDLLVDGVAVSSTSGTISLSPPASRRGSRSSRVAPSRVSSRLEGA